MRTRRGQWIVFKQCQGDGAEETNDIGSKVFLATNQVVNSPKVAGRDAIMLERVPEHGHVFERNSKQNLLKTRVRLNGPKVART